MLIVGSFGVSNGGAGSQRDDDVPTVGHGVIEMDLTADTSTVCSPISVRHAFGLGSGTTHALF
jgi:hypothetical protein